MTNKNTFARRPKGKKATLNLRSRQELMALQKQATGVLNSLNNMSDDSLLNPIINRYSECSRTFNSLKKEDGINEKEIKDLNKLKNSLKIAAALIEAKKQEKKQVNHAPSEKSKSRVSQSTTPKANKTSLPTRLKSTLTSKLLLPIKQMLNTQLSAQPVVKSENKISSPKKVNSKPQPLQANRDEKSTGSEATETEELSPHFQANRETSEEALDAQTQALGESLDQADSESKSSGMSEEEELNLELQKLQEEQEKADTKCIEEEFPIEFKTVIPPAGEELEIGNLNFLLQPTLAKDINQAGIYTLQVQSLLVNIPQLSQTEVDVNKASSFYEFLEATCRKIKTFEEESKLLVPILTITESEENSITGSHFLYASIHIFDKEVVDVKLWDPRSQQTGIAQQILDHVKQTLAEITNYQAGTIVNADEQQTDSYSCSDRVAREILSITHETSPYTETNDSNALREETKKLTQRLIVAEAIQLNQQRDKLLREIIRPLINSENSNSIKQTETVKEDLAQNILQSSDNAIEEIDSIEEQLGELRELYKNNLETASDETRQNDNISKHDSEDDSFTADTSDNDEEPSQWIKDTLREAFKHKNLETIDDLQNQAVISDAAQPIDGFDTNSSLLEDDRNYAYMYAINSPSTHNERSSLEDSTIGYNSITTNSSLAHPEEIFSDTSSTFSFTEDEPAEIEDSQTDIHQIITNSPFSTNDIGSTQSTESNDIDSSPADHPPHDSLSNQEQDSGTSNVSTVIQNGQLTIENRNQPVGNLAELSSVSIADDRVDIAQEKATLRKQLLNASIDLPIITTEAEHARSKVGTLFGMSKSFTTKNSETAIQFATQIEAGERLLTAINLLEQASEDNNLTIDIKNHISILQAMETEDNSLKDWAKELEQAFTKQLAIVKATDNHTLQLITEYKPQIVQQLYKLKIKQNIQHITEEIGNFEDREVSLATTYEELGLQANSINEKIAGTFELIANHQQANQNGKLDDQDRRALVYLESDLHETIQMHKDKIDSLAYTLHSKVSEIETCVKVLSAKAQVLVGQSAAPFNSKLHGKELSENIKAIDKRLELILEIKENLQKIKEPRFNEYKQATVDNLNQLKQTLESAQQTTLKYKISFITPFIKACMSQDASYFRWRQEYSNKRDKSLATLQKTFAKLQVNLKNTISPEIEQQLNSAIADARQNNFKALRALLDELNLPAGSSTIDKDLEHAKEMITSSYIAHSLEAYLIKNEKFKNDFNEATENNQPEDLANLLDNHKDIARLLEEYFPYLNTLTKSYQATKDFNTFTKLSCNEVLVEKKDGTAKRANSFYRANAYAWRLFENIEEGSNSDEAAAKRDQELKAIIKNYQAGELDSYLDNKGAKNLSEYLDEDNKHSRRKSKTEQEQEKPTSLTLRQK